MCTSCPYKTLTLVGKRGHIVTTLKASQRPGSEDFGARVPRFGFSASRLIKHT